MSAGQLGEQHGAYQGVHREPALDTDAVDEQAAGLGPLEKLAGIGSTGEGIGEARIDAIDHRRLDQDIDDVGILDGQHLVPDVVVDQELALELGGDELLGAT